MPRAASKFSWRTASYVSLIIVGLTFMFIAVSCGDDENRLIPTGIVEYKYDKEEVFTQSPNVTRMGNVSNASNRQVVTMGDIQAASEGTIDLREVAARIEIPRLQGGNRNLFVVHTVPTYGVNYCLEWNYDLRAQYWSAFRWDRSNTGKSTTRSDEWDTDPLIPSNYRTDQSDYSSSGYTRGHIVASEDRVISLAANKQTFYYSNMHPQNGTFNSDKSSIWWHLENKIIRNRYNIDTFRDTLYVVKGGTISEKNGKRQYALTPKNLVVPNYFFVAILCNKYDNYKAIGFWMPHNSSTTTDYKSYAKSINQLEELTGLDFFCNLPDDIEEKVEGTLSLNQW